MFSSLNSFTSIFYIYKIKNVLTSYNQNIFHQSEQPNDKKNYEKIRQSKFLYYRMLNNLYLLQYYL